MANSMCVYLHHYFAVDLLQYYSFFICYLASFILSACFVHTVINFYTYMTVYNDANILTRDALVYHHYDFIFHNSTFPHQFLFYYHILQYVIIDSSFA